MTDALPSDARPKCDCPPHAVSPSQIDTYKKCPRRWGFRKLAHRSEPETSSQKAGKAIHERLEKYALTGHLPHLDSDKYAKPVWAAVKYLPKPNPKHECEQHVRHDFWAGKDDEINEESKVIHGYPDLLPNTPPASVVDYKTTSVQSPPFRYALTPEKLATDTQGVFYANVMKIFGPGVLLKWIYIERAPPYRIHVVEVTLSKADIVEGMARIEKTVLEMYAHREKCDALGAEGASEPIVDYVNGLPANTDHCGAYGGCPHANVCTAFKPFTFASLAKKDSHVPLDLAKLAANIKSGNNPDAANAGDAVTSSAAPTPEPDQINSPREDLGDEDHDVEIRKMEAAIEAKKKAAEQAKLAALKAKADAEKAAQKAATKRPKFAEGQESAEPASAPSGTGSGFTIEIRAIASGDSLDKALAFLKSNVAAL